MEGSPLRVPSSPGRVTCLPRNLKVIMTIPGLAEETVFLPDHLWNQSPLQQPGLSPEKPERQARDKMKHHHH